MSRGKVTGLTRILLAFLGLMLVVGSTAVRADEVTVVQYPDSNYEPGPGWPEGWTPPPVPTEIADHMREWITEIMAENPKFKQMEMRVLDPLPNWTKEYPYQWISEAMACGETIYAYWYPTPDTYVISKTYGRSFGPEKAVSGNCRFEPIRYINESHGLSKERQEIEARKIELEYLRDKSHPGLGRDNGSNSNGSSEHIYVFLNEGAASKHFDVPAYLDASVGRVRVPIRFVSEFMGANVSWDEATQQARIHFPETSREVLRVTPAPGYTHANIFDPERFLPEGERFLLEPQTVKSPGVVIILTVGSKVALVNNKQVDLDAPPVIIAGRTMVPVRFVAEQMGAKVYWVGDQPIFRLDDGSLSGTYQVHIYTSAFPLYEYPSWYMENRAIRY